MLWNRCLSFLAAASFLAASALLWSAQSPDSAHVKTLFDAGRARAGYFDWKEFERAKNAVASMVKAGDRSVPALLRFLKQPYANRRLKHEVLCALGKIGTPRAIKAIDDFERWAESRRANPPPFRLDYVDSALEAAFTLTPSKRRQGRNGAEYAVIDRHGFYGRLRPRWLISTRNSAEWTPPVLFPPELAVDSTLDALAAGRKTIQDIAPDSDTDGLTDLFEELLSTNPSNPDSDGDGAEDGIDGSPLIKPSPADEASQMRQAAFTALFAASSNSEILLVVKGTEFDRQSFRGYAGWIVPTREQREGWVNIYKMAIERSGNRARVEIADFESGLCAHVHTATLERKHGRWVVVDFRMTEIS